MARSSFLFRTDPRILEALRRWADDELRSVNGQMEFLLREALRDAGRLKTVDGSSEESASGESVPEKPSPDSKSTDDPTS